MSDLIQMGKPLLNKCWVAKPHYSSPWSCKPVGEHTDYNGLYCHVRFNYQTVVVAKKQEDNLVRVVSVDYGNAVGGGPDITCEIAIQQDKMGELHSRCGEGFLLVVTNSLVRIFLLAATCLKVRA